MRRLLVALTTSALLAGATAATASADVPAPPTATRVVSASLTGPGTLVRAQVGTMRVTLHLTDPAGVVPRPLLVGLDETLLCPCVTLRQDQALDPLSTRWRDVSLQLTSGTATDGIWTGTSAAGGVDAGVWRVAYVGAGTIADPGTADGADVERLRSAATVLSTIPSVTVRGRDWVRISVDPVAPRRSRSSGVPYPEVLRGSASYAVSGAPAAGIRVAFLSDGCDVATSQLRRTVVTDRLGRWSFAREDFSGIACVQWTPGLSHISALETALTAADPVTVGVRASARRVSRGGSVSVTATVRRAPGVTGRLAVWLQRWSPSSSGWVDVRKGVTSTNTMTIASHPPRGLSFSRVRVTGGPFSAPSPDLVLIGG